MKEDFPCSLVPFLVVCLSFFLYIHACGDTVQFVCSFLEARGRSFRPSVDVLRITKLVDESGVSIGVVEVFRLGALPECLIIRASPKASLLGRT